MLPNKVHIADDIAVGIADDITVGIPVGIADDIAVGIPEALLISANWSGVILLC